MQETLVWSLGQEDALEEGIATHSRILAWRIPRTKESGELQSMGSQRVGHGWTTARSHTKSHDWCPYGDVRGQRNRGKMLPWRQRQSDAFTSQQMPRSASNHEEVGVRPWSSVLSKFLPTSWFLLFCSPQLSKTHSVLFSSYPVYGTYCIDPRKLTRPTVFQTPRSMKSEKKKGI